MRKLREVLGHSQVDEENLDIEIPDSLASEIEDTFAEWEALENENDIHGDGSVAKYGSWDYPYRVFRDRALKIEDTLAEKYGIWSHLG